MKKLESLLERYPTILELLWEVQITRLNAAHVYNYIAFQPETDELIKLYSDLQQFTRGLNPDPFEGHLSVLAYADAMLTEISSNFGFCNPKVIKYVDTMIEALRAGNTILVNEIIEAEQEAAGVKGLSKEDSAALIAELNERGLSKYNIPREATSELRTRVFREVYSVELKKYEEEFVNKRNMMMMAVAEPAPRTIQ